MRLSAIDISGFKSFARPTHLEFREGITAIVGPNGSGKSNIADAIRWVLGEQSIKTLRGKKSEDVIFSGSTSRGRLGMAEVSLTLATTDDETVFDAAEVAITRQLTRSGDSVYLLNRHPVRLFDVADILAKAGFGQKTYTVIGQGMADAFVNASPTERRAMFEDATGVTSLIMKKEQTERKLEQTKEHLVRAKDLLHELEPRLRSLKRQASRARSRQETEEALHDAETRWFTSLWDMFKSDLTRAEQQIQAFQATITKLSGEIAARRGAGGTIADARRLPELRSAISTLQEEEQMVLVSLAAKGIFPDDDVDRNAEERIAREKEQQKLRLLEKETTENLHAKESMLETVRRTLRTLQHTLLDMQTRPLEAPRAVDIRAALDDILTRHERFLEQLQNVDALEELEHLTEQAEELKLMLQNTIRVLHSAERPTREGSTINDLRTQLEAAMKNEAILTKETTDLRVACAQLDTRIRAIEERLQTLEVSAMSSSSETRKAPALERLREIRAQRSAVTAEVSMIEGALLSVQTERDAAEQNLEQLRKSLHAAETEKHAIDVQVAATRARKEDMEHEVEARLGSAFLVALRTQHIARPSVTSASDLEASVHSLRKKLSDIGAIDEHVLDEETEVEQRVTYLREQLHDLEQAASNLREGIRELGTHIHRQFSDGLKQMHDAFHTYFRQMFGGGRAGLSIIKPRPIEHALPDLSEEDMEAEHGENMDHQETGAHIHELPAGVEIRATPPGKKLTSISQLSGGEKALTSIALLFAILSQRPSPFIVLDEVDAALDEANSRRFARMLKELARASQFLVITHNRSTMEAASAVYGVTMSDDGMSQLLSLKLSDVPEDAIVPTTSASL